MRHYSQTRRGGQPDGTRIVGRVRKVLPEQAFGFLVDDQGVEYFFHKVAVMNTEFRTLVPGMAVEFEPITTEKGPRAIEIHVLDE